MTRVGISAVTRRKSTGSQVVSSANIRPSFTAMHTAPPDSIVRQGRENSRCRCHDHRRRTALKGAACLRS